MTRILIVALALLSLAACSEIALPGPTSAPPTETTVPLSPEPAITSIATSAPASPTSGAASASPAAAPRCPIAATRTPPPGAPTYIPGGPMNRTSAVDPHVEVCASASTAHPGDRIEITGLAVDIGLPIYSLLVRDETAGDWIRLTEISYENRVRFLKKDLALFEVAGSRADMQQVTFQLEVRRAGRYAFRINATGEIHYGYPGPATFSGAGSDPIEITVEP